MRAAVMLTPVAVMLTPVGVMLAPVVVNLNGVCLKGWALFAQPFFCRVDYTTCHLPVSENGVYPLTLI